MKAILVINHMPSRCEECPCSSIDYETDGEMMFTCDAIPFGYLELSEENMIDKKPSWCPLKPMPQKNEIKNEEEFMNVCGWMFEVQTGMDIGWNDCIDEIMGETE